MYSAPELAALVGTAERVIRKAAQRALENGRETITTKGQVYYVRRNGRNYEFSATPFKEAHAGAWVSLSGDDSVPTPQRLPFADPDVQAQFDTLSDKEKKIVDFKVHIAKEWFKNEASGFNRLSASAFIEEISKRFEIELSSAELVIRREYLYRWSDILKNEGEAGFLKKTGRKEGSHLVPQWAIDEIRQLFWRKSGGITNQNIYHILNLRARQRGELSDKEYANTLQKKNAGGIISLRRIQEITKKLKITRTYEMGKNPDSFKNKTLPGFGDMREKAEYANHYWEIDSTKLDAFGKDANGESTWSIIAISDVKSAMKVASIVKNSNAQGIAELLYKAFDKIGIPEHIITDNGKDYLSNHFIGILNMLGIKHQKTAPYSGEQKPFAERHFGTLQNSFTELLNGFKGHSVSQMQAINARTSTPERLSGRIPDKETEQITEIAAKLDNWIENVYAHAYNRGLERTPYEAYVEDKYIITRRDMKSIAYVFGKRHERVVGKKGIAIGTKIYNNNEGLLGDRVTDSVLISIDMLNDNIGYCYEAKTSKFICTLTTDKMTQEGAKAARMIYKADIAKHKAIIRDAVKSQKGRDYIQEINEASAEVFGNLTPIEEIGGEGFTQNAGNLDFLVEQGQRINEELDRLNLLSEGPNLEIAEALVKAHEEQRPAVRKLITPYSIIEDELAELYGES